MFGNRKLARWNKVLIVKHVKACFCVVSLFWSILSVGQQTSVVTALDVLRKTHPEVKWESTTAVVADVRCDGSKDTVMLGSQGTKAWVAVVPSTQSHKAQTFSFPIAGDRQNSFCSMPIRIVTKPLDCKSDRVTLPGCKPVKSCREFSVIDNDCDPFNFYWDSSRNSFAWWRN